MKIILGTKQKIKIFLIASTILLVFFFQPLVLVAANEENTPDMFSKISNGIVKIVTSCTDENGNFYYVTGGSGFIVGTNNSEQYILTDYHLVNPSEHDYEQIRRGVGLPVSAKLTPQISLYFDGGITINATVVAASKEMGYSLLKADTELTQFTAVSLGTTASVSRKDELYLIGYFGEYSLLGQDTLPAPVLEYSNHTVTSIERETCLLTIDGYPSSENTGAPLISESGAVVGMITYKPETDSTQVIPAESLIAMLETLNITYYDTNPANDYNIADSATIEAFEQLLSECQQDVILNASNYSKSSLKKYKAAIEEALELTAKDNITKDDYLNCIDKLKKAKSKLKPHNFVYQIIQLILAIIIFALLVLNYKQRQKEHKMLSSLHPETRVKKKKRKQLAALIRIDTNEVIWITKKGLRIGKNKKEVDYCIYHEPTVSRYHAAILYEHERFFIIDNYSTNKTGINHSYIEPDKLYELFDEDTISIANINFTFRYMPDN